MARRRRAIFIMSNAVSFRMIDAVSVGYFVVMG